MQFILGLDLAEFLSDVVKNPFTLKMPPSRGFEFPWAWGPPMGMKVPY